MTYTIRNLVDDAYTKAGVIGQGITMDSKQLSTGVSNVNLILDSVFAQNKGNTIVTFDVTFDGSKDYTVGQSGESPDIVLPLNPIDIDRIVLKFDGYNTVVNSINPYTYAEQDTEIYSEYPSYFYFEKSNPLGVIRFLDAAPERDGQIIYKPSMVDVDANTDFKYFPRELKPYLVFELASMAASENGYESQSLKAKANNYWNQYSASTWQSMQSMSDRSAPNSGHERYNIYKG